MAKVAITGSTGFVGKNLIPYLKKAGNDIVFLDRVKLNPIVGDIFNNCDIIIHLAGKAHDISNRDSSSEYYAVNYELTKNIYTHFLSSEAKIFIFVSSVKAAADSVENILFEDVIPNPQTHYGKSKLMAEDYIRTQALPAHKKFYILRPCMIHGPGNRGNLNLLFKFLQTRLPYPLASFENRRSFLSIENFCFIIQELIRNPTVTSGTYNLSDDIALSTNDVIAILAETTNRKAKMWHVPKSIVLKLAKIGDFLKLPLNTERLNKLTDNYVVSNNKIKVGLKTDLPIGSAEGLKITAEFFKSNPIKNAKPKINK